MFAKLLNDLLILASTEKRIKDAVNLRIKIEASQAKMRLRGNCSFRFRMGALIASDSRPGQVWAIA